MKINQERIKRLSATTELSEVRKKYSEDQRKSVAFYIGSLVNIDGLSSEEAMGRILLAADLALVGVEKIGDS